MRRIWAVAAKEFLHILRDPRSLMLAILQPLIMILLYGYAIDMDIKRLRVGILDLDHTQQSADFVRRMTSSNFILDAGRVASREEVETDFRRSRFHAVVVIPYGYARSLTSEQTTPVQVLVDGADGTTASAAGNYLNAVIALLSRDIMTEQFGTFKPPVEARTRVLYNPELISARFIVPGLVAVVMIMVCALLTSVAITREKESGTLEQILTTPIRPAQVIIGKVIPFVGIGVLDTAMVLAAGRFVFGVPMEGSWLVLTGYSLIYLVISLGLGLLISAITKTQQIAMMMAQLLTILPSMMLSGFIFPVTSMPRALQWFAHIIPATYYLRVIRGVMLQGESWFPFEGGIMILMAAILLGLAAKRFRVRLD
ncbi:MAG TPA: ABC transporter permease [bacterium]|jgi:ABC-2 type transport system permease protein